MKDLENLLNCWKNIREELNKAKEDKRVPADQRKKFRQEKKTFSGKDPMAGREQTQQGVSARGIETRRGDTRQKGAISHGYARVGEPEQHKDAAKRIARQNLEDTKNMPKAKLSKDSADPKYAPKDVKVKQLQQQIDSGKYKPDSKKIAGKMVERGVFSKGGQWKIEKSNYGPKGSGQYTPEDNIKRKKTRTSEEVDVGPNKAVRQYTTSGSTLSDMRNKKLQSKNKKQPVKSVQLSEEEKKQLQQRLSGKAGKDIKVASEDGVEKFSYGAPVTAAGGMAMTDKKQR